MTAFSLDPTLRLDHVTALGFFFGCKPQGGAPGTLAGGLRRFSAHADLLRPLVRQEGIQFRDRQLALALHEGFLNRRFCGRAGLQTALRPKPGEGGVDVGGKLRASRQGLQVEQGLLGVAAPLQGFTLRPPVGVEPVEGVRCRLLLKVRLGLQRRQVLRGVPL